MSQEEINHLERTISHVKDHIREQDAEIFRLSKLVDSLAKKLDNMEKRFAQSGMETPVDPDCSALDERPPHY